MNRRTTKREDVRAVMNGLRKIVRGLRLSAREAERTAGISGAQLFVLQSLSEEAAPSLNELSERTSTDQSSVSVVVRRLVDQGLVERRPSTEDARRVELRLTAAGKKLVRRCPEPTQARLVSALRRLGGGELAALRGGIEALVRGLGARSEAARMFFDEEAEK
jgi:DNA-binding MarR family transcriptional regulator